MNDPLTEIAFWRTVLATEARTIVCSAEMESRVKGYIAARGLTGAYTVHASRACPDNKLLVIDTDAMEAEMNETLARWRP